MWLPAAALVLGFVLVYATKLTVPLAYGTDLAVAALAGIEAALASVRSAMDRRLLPAWFGSRMLVTMLVAVGLVHLGKAIGLDLLLGVALALSFRLFQCVTAIHNRLAGSLPSPRG